MESTDQNLNEPLRVGDIDLQKEVDSWRSAIVQVINQEVYDLMNYHDPLTIYVIHDAIDGRIYLGDHLIQKDSISSKYLVGIDNTNMQYVLYMNIVERHMDRLIPICRYNDPEAAFNAMLMATNAGSVDKIVLSLYSVIAAYIDGNVSIHDFIMGIISFGGYKNDPRLQMVIDIATNFGVHQCREDLPVIFKEELSELDDRYDNGMFSIYSNIYNTIVKYNFFKDDKYHNGFERLDLNQPITDIIKVLGFSSTSTYRG